MRRNQHLITNDVERYMTEYEVRYALFFFFSLFCASAGAEPTTGQQGSRRYRPTRAVVGGLAFCMGSGWRVRILVCNIVTLFFFPPDEIPVRPG